MDVEDRVDEAIAAFLEEAEAGRSPDPAAYLERYPDLRDELASFFAARAEFEQQAAPLLPTGEAPRRVGDFVLLEEIARGGMGVVYRAYQQSLRRLVALKMIRSGPLAGDEELHRFRREAEQAAALDHPHIVPIYAVDAWRPDAAAPAVPYFAMRLYDDSLAGRLGDGRAPLGPRDAAGLVATVARAVHYAHQRGLLHRDLKPGNILLDAAGRPHVGDFGLARPLDGRSDLTASHAVVGTASYMAPEQAAGSRDLTVAVDVYGLGAILYECLTRRPPFAGGNVLSTLQAVRGDEPAAVRSLNRAVPRDLATICHKCLEKDPARRYPDAAALAEDLDRFVQGEPIQARPSGAFGRGLRWARRRPVVALLALLLVLSVLTGVVGMAVQMREAEHARGVAVEEADAARQARDAIKLEQERTAAALRRAEGLYLTAQASQVVGTDPVLGLLLAREAAERAPGLLANNTLRAALDACRVERVLGYGHHPQVTFSRDGRLVALGGTTCRVVEAATGKEVFALPGPDNQLEGRLALSPDGMYVAHWLHSGFVTLVPQDANRVGLAVTDRVVRLFDLATGKLHAQLLGHAASVASVEFSADGKTLLTGSHDRSARLWAVATGTPLRTLTGHVSEIRAARFSPDGSRVLTLATGWQTRTAYPEGPTVDPVEKPGEVPAWRRMPEGQVNNPIRQGGWGGQQARGEGSARVWDARTGEEVCHLGHETSALLGEMLEPLLAGSGVFTADGKVVLAHGGTRLKARVYDGATGKRLESWRHEGEFGSLSLALSPAGDRVVTVRGGDVVLLGSGGVTRTLSHGGEVTLAEYSPDGRWLATAGTDRVIRVWDMARQGDPLVLRGHRGPVLALAWSPDGKSLASTGADGQALLWRRSPTPPHEQRWKVDGATVLAASPDEARVAVGGKDGLVRLFDTATGKEVRTLTPTGPESLAKQPAEVVFGEVSSVEFDPAGGRLLVLHRAPCHIVDAREEPYAPARLFDLATGKEVARYAGEKNQWCRATLSPCGRRVLGVEEQSGRVEVRERGQRSGSSSHSGEPPGLLLFDAATGKRLPMPAQEPGPRGAVFARGGEEILTTCEPFVWYDAAGKEVRRLAVQRPGIEDPSRLRPAGVPSAWGYPTPDGKLMLTSDCHLVDLATGEVRHTLLPKVPADRPWPLPTAALHLRTHERWFHPDGRRVVVNYWQGSPPVVWDLATGQPLKTLRVHPVAATTVGFSADGRWLLTAGADTVHVWDAETLREVHTLTSHVAVASADMSKDGRRVFALLADGTCRVWELDVAALAKARSPRALTDAERERYEIER